MKASEVQRQQALFAGEFHLIGWRPRSGDLFVSRGAASTIYRILLVGGHGEITYESTENPGAVRSVSMSEFVADNWLHMPHWVFD